jgi:hypothetical protein
LLSKALNVDFIAKWKWISKFAIARIDLELLGFNEQVWEPDDFAYKHHEAYLA